MGIDTSIYSNIKPVQVEMPSAFDAAQKAMSLSQLGMQNQQMQYQMAQTNAIRQAMSTNMGQDGKLNRQTFLSQLGKSAPMAALDYNEKFLKQDKEQADLANSQQDAKNKQLDAAQKAVGIVWPGLDYVAGAPVDQKSSAYSAMIKNLDDQGVDTSRMPKEYDPKAFPTMYDMAKKSKPVLENMLAESSIIKNKAEMAILPIKLQSEMYGSRSPNAELTSQYDKQAAPIRSSQLAMNQMIDNYKHPSPQGDASLILNAFKIKFPTAPDVNSLKELSESQSASDHWKQLANRAISGGLDQPTRDNIMRDGVSTYRANVDSLRGIQERFKRRAQVQGVGDGTITTEPAIDKTFNEAMSLQDNIGPYVPPPERTGIMAGASKLASKLLGVGGSQPANAAPPAIKHGTVEDGFVYMGGDPGKQSNWKRAK